MAAALTAALGREITFLDAPLELFADSLRNVMPPWQVDGLLEDYAHYRRGEAAAVQDTVTEITGRQPRTSSTRSPSPWTRCAGPTATHIWQALAWITGALAVTIPAAVLRYSRTTAT